jgi:hypothetical protein
MVLHPPRHLPRTGRQHRAHPRREVPRAQDSATPRPLTQREFYYWAALLRSVSGFEIYRKVYRDVDHAGARGRTADAARRHAALAAGLHGAGGRQPEGGAQRRLGDTERLAGRMQAQLQFARIEDILDAGLDNTLSKFMKTCTTWATGSAAISSSHWEPDMHLSIRHETLYRYSQPQAYSIEQLHLTPRAEPQQRVLSWQIRTPGHCVAYTDAYGNLSHMLTLNEPHDAVRIVVEGVVAPPPCRTAACCARKPVAADLHRADAADHADADAGRARRALPAAVPPTPDTRDLMELAAHIYGAVAYQSGATDVFSTAGEAHRAWRRRLPGPRPHFPGLLPCARHAGALRVGLYRSRFDRPRRQPRLGRRLGRGRRLRRLGQHRHHPQPPHDASLLPAGDRARLRVGGPGARQPRAWRRLRDDERRGPDPAGPAAPCRIMVFSIEHRNDLLHRHAPRRRAGLPVRYAHQCRGRPGRFLPQDLRVRKSGRPHAW